DDPMARQHLPHSLVQRENPPQRPRRPPPPRGPTSYANGQGLCARCNYLKEHGLWVLTPLSRSGPYAAGPHADRAEESRPEPSAPPGAWVWTSPHGAVGTSITPPLITPWPDPPPGEDDHGPP